LLFGQLVAAFGLDGVPDLASLLSVVLALPRGIPVAWAISVALFGPALSASMTSRAADRAVSPRALGGACSSWSAARLSSCAATPSWLARGGQARARRRRPHP
jgi:hypothetical protein